MWPPFVLAHLVFDPVHEIVDLIFFEDVVFKGHLPKDLNGSPVGGFQSGAMWASDDEMHLYIFHGTDLHGGCREKKWR